MENSNTHTHNKKKQKGEKKKDSLLLVQEYNDDSQDHLPFSNGVLQ